MFSEEKYLSTHDRILVFDRPRNEDISYNYIECGWHFAIFSSLRQTD